MFKRAALGVILLSVVVFAQSSGTPNNLRVKTDANGYLVTSALAQTNPVFTSTFSQTRLKTDSSGSLLVVVTGGVASLTGLTANSGTLTASTPFQFSQTWNNAAVVFTGFNIDITNTASDANSLAFSITSNGGMGNTFRIFRAGNFISLGAAQINGTITNIAAGSFIAVQSDGSFRFSASSILDAPADGQMRLINASGSSGFCMDGAATDSTLTVGSRGACSTLGSVTAAQFQNSNATNGQKISALQTLTELTTIAAAATTDTTIQMPANAVILGVAVRVTTVIPTATTFTVGDSGSAARFSTAAVSTAATSTDPGTKAGAYYNASALSIRITPNMTPANNSGRVRTTIFYYTVTPPTS